MSNLYEESHEKRAMLLEYLKHLCYNRSIGALCNLEQTAQKAQVAPHLLTIMFTIHTK